MTLSISDNLSIAYQLIVNSFMRPIDNRRLSNATAESFNKQIKDYIAISNGVTKFH